MSAQGVSVSGRRLSGLSVSICMAMAMTALAASPAEARKRYRAQPGATANYAAYVVDANTGRTLFARNEDALRHPASVTKVMTLYLLFEQLEKGRYRLDSPLRVSAHGASMAPSKLGLRPGQTIEVEDAIKALVTKSANDVAATVAENIGGDEDAFAEMMTRKARSLGMRSTVYRNASGLPNPQQVTTARDLSILGRAIQERFPSYYRYFGTPSFRYGSQTIRNHNKLLGRVEGVDGIKTGYTRASGFNLLTSARRGGRHIVGVVLGGRTGRERDIMMAQLVNTQIAHASPVRGSSQIAALRDDDEDDARVAAPQRMAMAAPATESSERPRMVAEPQAEPVRRRLAPMALASAQTPMAAAAVAAAQAIKARPAVVSDEDEGVTTASVRPPQKIIGARPAVMAAASTPAALPLARRLADKRVALVTPPSREALADLPAGKRAKAAATPDDDEDAKPARGAKADKTDKTDKAKLARLDDKSAKTGKQARKDKDAEERTEVAKSETGKSRQAAARDGMRPSGWSIQIGATDNVEKANALLAKARGAGHLASARSYTEKVQKGSATLYRARFAGLETDQAQTACKQLKRSGFACFATKD